MNELFSLLNMKERRTAAILGAVLGAASCLLLFVSIKEHGTANRVLSELKTLELDYKALSQSRNDIKKEWQGWQDALKEMEALRANYFYDSKKIMQTLRLDLQQIFDATGIQVTDINYGYLKLVKESLQRVTVEFRFSGNYAMLKRLLDTIERHPRFLHVEKIDFLSIGKQPGLLDLRISLAGYDED